MVSLWLAAFGLACIETGVNVRPIEAVAVVAGDFDDISESLGRQLIDYQTYEGYVCCASYDPDLDPDLIALESETLFSGTSEEGGRELFIYDAVMLNSGARGFGAWQYNGVEADDHLVADPTVVDNVKEFVDRAGLVWLSDWSYDLIEAAFPDEIDFYGDDDILDSAQVGTARISSVQYLTFDVVGRTPMAIGCDHVDPLLAGWTELTEAQQGALREDLN